jgi:hypothetical protein
MRGRDRQQNLPRGNLGYGGGTFPGRVANNRGCGTRGGRMTHGPRSGPPLNTTKETEYSCNEAQKGIYPRCPLIMIKVSMTVMMVLKYMNWTIMSHLDDSYDFPDTEYYGGDQLGTNESNNQYQDYGGVAGNEFGQRSRMNPTDNDSRYIGMFHTSKQPVCMEPQQESRHILQLNMSELLEGHIELDSHADTCTAGKNARILSYSNKLCRVSPYYPQYQAIPDVPIVQVRLSSRKWNNLHTSDKSSSVC